MLNRRVHPLIAWLCLIWFGLTNTIHAGGLAICRDGHGGVSIEWGCDRNAHGECVNVCGDEVRAHDPATSHPCEDTPVLSELQFVKAASRATTELRVPVPVLLAVLFPRAESSRPAVARPDSSSPERPPDELKHIRSVILVV